MLPEDEFFDLFARFIGAVREEDFMDPEMAALGSQLVSILEPKAEPLPLSMIERLKGIKSKLDRFKEAATLLEITDPQVLKRLSDSLRAAGLMKIDA